MSFFDSITSGISSIPADAWASLAQGLASSPNLSGGLTAGLSGFAKAVQDAKKKQGLAQMLGGMQDGIPEADRPFFNYIAQNDPEMAMQGLAGKLFAKPNEPTSAIQNYEYAKKQGYNGTFNEFQIALARAGAAGTPSVDIPGVGPIDPRTGAPAGSPAPAPSLAPPPPRAPAAPSRGAPMPPPPSVVKPDSPGQFFNPAMHPELGDGMSPPPLNAADFPPPAGAPAATPPQASAPATPYRPVLDAQAKALNLGAPPSGKMWVYGADNRPMLQSVAGANPTSPNEAQMKGSQYLTEALAAANVLNNPSATAEFLKNKNAVLREGGDLTSAAQSGPSQAYYSAAATWLGNFLYQKSGAQISPSEFSRGQDQYIPKWGDKPEVLAQKAFNRKVAETGLMNTLTPEQQTQVLKSVDQLVKARPPVVQFPTPPQAAINDLKMRRDKAKFDEVFGPGAADKYLGGK